MSNFIAKCLTGEAHLDDVDDYVEEWHLSKGEVPLFSFLGMKKDEYALWVADSDVLEFIVTAHRKKKNVSEIMEEMNSLPLVVRSDGF